MKTILTPQDTTYEPVMSSSRVQAEASAGDNLETSAELLNIERSLYELSQRQARAADGGGVNIRNSFLSVDSGESLRWTLATRQTTIIDNT